VSVQIPPEPSFAWLLRQDDLDRLPRAYDDDPTGEPITASVVAPDEEEPLNLGPRRTNVVDMTGQPARPHPASNAWPDNAVTVSYAELRKLVALHLDLARQAMPNTSPWAWIKHRAQAMRDGEAPLLLSEVLDQ
jgi:hypothetical protein